MSNPTPRSSVAHIPAIESSSILHRLLREINDNDAPRSDPVFPATDVSGAGKASVSSSRRASLNLDIIASQYKRPSVWAKGGSAAEDARLKLRALDEARLRKPSVISTRFDNPTAPSAAIASRKPSADLPSPPFFSEIQYSPAGVVPTTGSSSPTLEHAIRFPLGKRERSGAYSPDILTKRLRQESFPDIACRDREYCSPNPIPGNMIMNGGSVVTTQFQNTTSDDPVLRLESFPRAPSTPPSPLYGFRSTPKHAYKPFRPATPRRSPTPSDSGSPGATPPWARPLHLVEDDVSIYKNVHGNKSHEHPLCLYCFRQHGDFNKVVNQCCEVCGQGEVLEGHYWEAPFWS